MQILEPVSESGNSAKNRVCLIYKMQRNKFSNAYISHNLHINKNNERLSVDLRGQSG